MQVCCNVNLPLNPFIERFAITRREILGATGARALLVVRARVRVALLHKLRVFRDRFAANFDSGIYRLTPVTPATTAADCGGGDRQTTTGD